MLKVIELFAGLGSQTQALKNIGVEHKVVAISEIDKFALKSYEALHGNAPNYGDITQIHHLPKADLWTYSFPCQDISCAGLLAGINKNTRSGLLFHVERLLLKAEENNSLPKYLLLENVKNLVSKKFKPDFDKWTNFLSSLGYTNYWDILNAKDYGIPQSRARVFCVSILGKHKPYTFPQKEVLKLKLQDMLEDEVDEKFYLSMDNIKSILSSTFRKERNRIENYELCNTLCARDFKNPQCVRVGILGGEKWEKMHDISRRVYSTLGLSPTIHTSQGGGTAVKIVDDLYQKREPRIYEDTAPTLRGQRHGLKVISGQFQPVDRDYKSKNAKRQEYFECRSDELSNAILTMNRKNCVKIYSDNDSIAQNDIRENAENTTQQTTTQIENYCSRIRKLTPRECFRLMGWKDSSIDCIINAGISNSQCYKLSGNGIVLQVLEKIFAKLFL